MKSNLKLFEEFDGDETNESINQQVRAKIVVWLKQHGIENGKDYEFTGGEFLANDIETARDMADAVAGKFKIAIYDNRPTKDGKIPVMIVEAEENLSEDVRSATDAEFRIAREYVKKNYPGNALSGIGVDKKTGDIYVGYEPENGKGSEKSITLSSKGELLQEEELFETTKQTQGKKPVNIMVGRFQPFHIGHLKAAEQLYKANGLPVVLVTVRGSGKAGKGTSFSEKLTDQMIDEAIKHEKFIEGHVKVTSVAFNGQLFPALRPKYEPVILGAGQDRLQSYQNQVTVSRDKFDNVINLRDDFEVKLTGRFASGTAVRETITKGDQKGFEKLMPKYLHSYWAKLSAELNESVNEDESKQTIEDTKIAEPVKVEAKDIKGFQHVEALKKDIETTKDAIEKIRVAIENGAKEPRAFEAMAKLTQRHQQLITEMKNVLETLRDGKND